MKNNTTGEIEQVSIEHPVCPIPSISNMGETHTTKDRMPKLVKGVVM
jgi:hypothetical protein